MRVNAGDYDLIAPRTLEEALRILTQEPRAYLPLAGGTELMVAFGAGRLTARKLLSLHYLQELRFIKCDQDAVTIGSGTTFTELRQSSWIGKEFNLLSQAASWTGSVANQNRGTLGGNIANASPAADSSPALLVYDAKVNLVSVRGIRAVPYREFHVGYKRTVLAADELVHSVVLPRSDHEWRSYIRKVGTRNAQAITKVAVAGLARAERGLVCEVRLAAGSLSEMPIRCPGVESLLQGSIISDEVIYCARLALLQEARPIDDIRSTAQYRAAVAGNLLEEFLTSLR